MQIFTDLALESSVYKESDRTTKQLLDKLSCTVINKGDGKHYITYECFDNIVKNINIRKSISGYMAESIIKLLDYKKLRNNKILIIGLGNRGMTADALGPRVVDRIIIKTENDTLCAFTPSVTGLTGLETFDIVKGISDRVKPSAIIAIDTLASRKVNRIGSAFQLSDNGISPGSGVGNNRVPINSESMNIPVIAIGVPLVVYAKTLAQDVLSSYLDEADKNDLSTKAVEVIRKSLDYKPSDLVVTPKEIDIIVDASADIISSAINIAFWGKSALN